MSKIAVVIGSVREGRFGDKPAKWIFEHLRQRQDIEPRMLDLRNFPMPLFDQASTPVHKRAPFDHEAVQRWTAAIKWSEGFVLVTPEYNFGPPASLKNALDWVYPEWNRKAVAFVSYGGFSGVRAVQQLRETTIELQLAPIRRAVHLPRETLFAHYAEGDVEAALTKSDDDAQTMIDDLLWWTRALSTARTATD